MLGFGHQAELHLRLGEVEENVRHGLQADRATEQARRGESVAARERPTAGTHEPGRGSFGKHGLRFTGRRELGPVSVGTLQVVADDLVEVGSACGAILDPVGVTLVQIGARPFGHRFVRRVANEDVAEAEAVLSGEGSPVGTDQLLPDERLQMAGEVVDLDRAA